MYLLIVFLPLIGAVLAGFFGKQIGSLGAIRITTLSVILSCFFSYIAFYEVGLLGSPCYITLMVWIQSEIFSSNWGFLFDSLTVIMLVVVTSVSTLVHIYSIEYMSNDPHRSRFMAYLSLFTFFMLLLVTADNFIQMFVGWEGVGLCSYLLINFWFTRIQANKAAIKAMLVNRVGDFGLALGIIGIFVCFKSVDYSTVFALTPILSEKLIYFFNSEFLVINLICILLFVGAAGKSAQVGLHTWLPDAMEGPTPVSALIHAATMVTAGVFLIARCSPLFEASSNALSIITVLGSITAFFAATTGLLQNDLKKVIAYSTCSQLGYMIFACGLSNYSVGIFHLANHAFFKALLFLGAGSVIHAMADEQDIRRMGGLRRIIPFTYAMMFIGSLSLMGFPFLTGFYSKDLILELAYAKYTISSHFAYWLGTMSAFLTAFYSIRLLYLTFLTKTNSYKQSLLHAHDAPFIMALPLLILSFGSIFIGYFTKDMIVGVGTNFWGNAIYTAPQNTILLDAEFLPPFIKLIPVIFSLGGAFTSFFCYSVYSNTLYIWKLNNLGQILYNFFNRKWFFDKIYNDTLVQYSLIFGYNTTYKTVDRGLIEIFGPFGLSQKLYNKSLQLSKFQTGLVYDYALYMLQTLNIFILLSLPFYFSEQYFSTNLQFPGLIFNKIVFLIILCMFFKNDIINLNNNNKRSIPITPIKIKVIARDEFIMNDNKIKYYNYDFNNRALSVRNIIDNILVGECVNPHPNNHKDIAYMTNNNELKPEEIEYTIKYWDKNGLTSKPIINVFTDVFCISGLEKHVENAQYYEVNGPFFSIYEIKKNSDKVKEFLNIQLNEYQFKNSQYKFKQTIKRSFSTSSRDNSKYITLNINNIPLRVKENTTILQACESIGVVLPRFCYHEYLSIAGNCRMCLVEVEKSMKPVVSCSMPVMKDMKIFTNTPLVQKARENVLEMLLINHPLDCPICDQGGECDLQQNTLEYGSDRTRFFFKKRGVENFIFNPLIKTVMTRCFHCTRCVRFASEIAGATVLGTIGRGKVTEVSTFIPNKFNSLFSGNISDLCPVGALTTNANAFSSRKWERTTTNSIDILDGLGSNINIDTVKNQVVRISSSYNSDINKYGISDKIRYSFDSITKLRLNHIFKKNNTKDCNSYEIINWKEAFEIIQNKISKLKGSEMGVVYGPFSDLKTIYNAKYFFNKLGSSNIGTEFTLKNSVLQSKNNLDEVSYENLNFVSTYTRQLIDFDSNYKLNTNVSGIEEADLCLLLGINPHTEATALTPRLHLMNINKNVTFYSIGPTTYHNLAVDNIGVNISEILNSILQGKHKICYNFVIKYSKPVFLIGSLLSVRSDNYILNKKIKNISFIIEIFQKNKRIFAIKKNKLINNSKITKRTIDLFFPRKIMNFINYSASITGGLELGIIPGKTSLFNDLSISNSKLLYFLDTSIINFSKNKNDEKQPLIIYQGHHITLNNKSSFKPDLILPSTTYSEKNNSMFINVEGKVQFLEQATFKRSSIIKNDSKILKSLIDFNGIIYSSLKNKNYTSLKKQYNIFKNNYQYNQELKFLSFASSSNNKNLKETAYFIKTNCFETNVIANQLIQKDILAGLFITNLFQDSLSNSSSNLKIYNKSFNNYTIYNSKLYTTSNVKKQDFLFKNTLIVQLTE